jgi:hypothetical protein
MTARFFPLLVLLLALSSFVVPPSGGWSQKPPQGGTTSQEPPLRPRDREHWSFVKPVRPAVPSVQGSAQVSTPVDAFLLSRLEKAGLTFAPAADRATLLRRVTFDLTGLPPTAEELEAFLQDTRPDAYVRVVDRLLASPHHGERWAQHWLDVVRYAESNGYELDGERPHAWRYRDWVVKAFNDDMPYDRFLTEQLAGDLLARGKDPIKHADLLIATGLNRCGPVHQVSGNLDPDVTRQEVLTEMTATVGAAVLGLTVHCARCHDHKFDPISQADYYRLQAYFTKAKFREIDTGTEAEKGRHDKLLAEFHAAQEPLRKQLTALESPYRQKLTERKKANLEPEYRAALAVPAAKRTAEQKKQANEATNLIRVSWDEILREMTPADRQTKADLRAKLHKLEDKKPEPAPRAWSIEDDASLPATHLLVRGDPKKKGPLMTAAPPRVLVEPKAAAAAKADRLALAEWLTRPDHPLTARVLVNRLWQHHFGRGIVATPNDFGLRGDRPTHPELLDWLATEFMHPSPPKGGEGPGVRGWSIKHLHRLMVLSTAYRQTSQANNAKAKKLDPDNSLLWRMNRRRLEGETLRDNLLAAAGTLNRKFGGPMVRVPLEPEVYELIFTEGEPDGLWHAHPDPREHTRRTLYLFAKRNVRLPLLEAFDQPDTLTSCPVRGVSTFAPQALILFNGPLAQEQSKAFALRLLKECGTDRPKQVRRAYQLAFGREPRPADSELALAFLKEQAALVQKRIDAGQEVAHPTPVPMGVSVAEAAALGDFCLALVNSNEFVYVK